MSTSEPGAKTQALGHFPQPASPSRLLFWSLGFVSLLLSLPLYLAAQPLDQTWQVQLGGRSVQVNDDGSFLISNVGIAPQSALIQTNPDAPTLPHFARLFGFKVDGDQLRYVYSPPLEIQAGATIEVSPDDLTFSDNLPVMVTNLALSADQTELPAIGDTAQLQVTATRSDGSQPDVTAGSNKTVYQSSDNNIATISEDGVVTARTAGSVYVSAIHEGLTASTVIRIVSPPTNRTIIGFVYGPEGQPLSNALVQIPGSTKTAATSFQGRYVMTDVSPPVGELRVRVVGNDDHRLFGQSVALNMDFAIVDGGIITGRSIAQLLAMPCTDPDQDCLSDEMEVLLGLDPNDSDSDDNGVPDGLEDADNDLVVNRLEEALGTNPQLADSDLDSVSDGDEILRYRSLPTLPDTDGDGTLDGQQDQDNDTLLDLAEDLNGNYVIDDGESSPFLSDTDGDAVLDPQELLDESSPSNGFDYEPRALGHFTFDTALMTGAQGQFPLDNVGASLITSFGPFGRNGFHASNGNRLVYRVREPNNELNINLLRGTIQFWFKPDWSSGEVGHPFGSRLIEIGQFSSTGQGNAGWWGLFLDSNRTTMFFASQGPNSAIWERYIQAVDLNFQEGEWYHIELTYGPRTTYPYGIEDPTREQRHSNSYLFINGERQGSGFGVNPALLPNEAAISGGFVIGSRHDGTLAAEVVFDELKTYNYPLHSWNQRILTDRNWAAVADPDDNSLTLARRFPTSPALPMAVDIYRRLSGSDNWGQPIAANYTFPLFQDPSAQRGIAYEYRIWDTNSPPNGGFTAVLPQYLTAAIELPAVHQRGKAIMVVENSISAELDTEIARYKTDLVGDGWEVASLSVSRQNDDDLDSNRTSINVIKNLIDLEIDHNRTNIVILLGHVPVPMSGTIATDGHDDQPQNRPDHRGAWTADGFYGSTDRAYWTDTGPTIIENLDNPQNSNFPNDGKFDQNYLPQPFGVPVGRIDFARMTTFIDAAFLPGHPNLDERSTEIELLRQYLNKNHRYRHGQLKFEPRTSAFRGFGQNLDTPSGLYNVQNVSAALFGLDEDRFINMRGIPLRASFSISFNEMNSFNTGATFGWEHLNASNTYSHRTSDLINLENEPSVAFYFSYGSYFGDWNLNVDNWLKALLCLPNSGLASLYYYPNKWRLEKMGLGAPIGVGMQEFNDQSKYSNYTRFPTGAIIPFYHESFGPPRMLSILGDPTLRIHILPPASQPGSSTQGRQATLNWTAAAEPDVQYHIYRSTMGIEGPFFLQTAFETVNGTTWTDVLAPTGPKVYAIRAAKSYHSGSGSYINLSQAIFAEVN